MSLSEQKRQRREKLRAGAKVMSGNNPRQSAELQSLEEEKWDDVDPEQLLTESEEIEVYRMNRKDPYENRGYDFSLIVDFEDMNYVFTGEYDLETVTIGPAELDETTMAYELDDALGKRDIYQSLRDEVNEKLAWEKLD